MSWFGSNKNGGHNDYNKPRSGELGHVHRPVIIDHNGVKHPIVGLDYESHNFQQYKATTEKVVQYRRLPGMADKDYMPSRIEEYGTGNLFGRKDEFSTKSHDDRVRGPIKDSPWNNGFRFNSPPSKDHRHATEDDDERPNLHVNSTKGPRQDNINDQEYHDNKNNKINDFTREGFRPNYHRDQEDYYEHVSPKVNVYSPPKYSAQISTHQEFKEKGNDHATRARMGPFRTPPSNETSYETSNFKPVSNSPPLFNPQPKKEERNHNQQTIDSTEARRRYGMGVSEARPGFYAEGNYTGGTISSKEAAERYNGVLLTN